MSKHTTIHRLMRKSLTAISLIGIAFSVLMLGSTLYTIQYLGRHNSIWLVRGGIGFMHATTPATWDEEMLEPWHFDHYALIRGRSLGVGKVYNHKLQWLPSLTSRGAPLPSWHLWIPFWLPLALFMGLFLPSGRAIYAMKVRKKLGLCLKCGYSLKALPESRCPECGTPFEKP